MCLELKMKLILKVRFSNCWSSGSLTTCRPRTSLNFKFFHQDYGCNCYPCIMFFQLIICSLVAVSVPGCLPSDCCTWDMNCAVWRRPIGGNSCD